MLCRGTETTKRISFVLRTVIDGASILCRVILVVLWQLLPEFNILEICTVCSPYSLMFRYAHSKHNYGLCLHWISFSFVITWRLVNEQLRRKSVFKERTNTCIHHSDLIKLLDKFYVDLVKRMLNWSHEIGRKLHRLVAVSHYQ